MPKFPGPWKSPIHDDFPFLAPQAENDLFENIDEDLASDIRIADFLSNDRGGRALEFQGFYDPSAGSDLPHASQSMTTQFGAVITVTDDNTISYDPTSSSIIQALGANETRVDSF